MVTDQINAGKRPDEVAADMKLTVMKEVGAQWLVLILCMTTFRVILRYA